MLRVNSVNYRDDKTGKVIEVNINNGSITSVTSDGTFTIDEYAVCSFHAGLLVSSGFKAIKEFTTQK